MLPPRKFISFNWPICKLHGHFGQFRWFLSKIFSRYLYLYFFICACACPCLRLGLISSSASSRLALVSHYAILCIHFMILVNCNKLCIIAVPESINVCQRPHIKIHLIEINSFCTQVCSNTPLLITYPKACEYLHNKEETDLLSNLVTELKVTECNKSSLTIFMQNQVIIITFNNVWAPLMSGHILGISDTCFVKDVWHSPVHSSWRACGSDFCVEIARLIPLHFITFIQ